MSLAPAILLDADIRAIEGIVTPLGRRGVPLIALSRAQDCPAFHSRYVTRRVPGAPLADEDGLIGTLLGLPERGVIVPSDDVSARLLARNRDTILAAGHRLGISTAETLERGFDKWKCAQVVAALDIPTPTTRLLEDGADPHASAATVGYPLVVKATTLAGGAYVRVAGPDDLAGAVTRMRELAARPENRTRRPRIMLQQWIDCAMEDLWCVETLYRRDKRPVGFLSLRKIRTNVNRDGTFGSRMYAGEAVPNPTLEALTERLLTHLGWQGFAHLDWMRSRTDGRLYLTEINPRLPGFSTVLAGAGFDLAWLYYADLEGLPAEPARPRPTLYFEPLRYPGDLSSAVATIARRQYSAWRFLASYARVLRGTHRVVVDFFSWRDPAMTVAVMLGMARTLVGELRRRPQGDASPRSGSVRVA
jgi:predicted ATP-grasp superfamily ATP-dependent carboligase